MSVDLVVGLTGGIASGKSTVARLFQELGVPVVDADEAARAVVAPGSDGLEAIRTDFGDDVLQSDGTLDRGRLRARIFRDPEGRQRLESLLHPLIRRWMDDRIAHLDGPYVIRMVPLLVETGQHLTVDRVLVVDLPRETQRERALARDGGDPAAIDGILTAQASREERLAVADDIIDNAATPETLGPAVQALHESYLALAARLRADRRK